MIKNRGLKLPFSISFSIALLFHVVVLFFVKKKSFELNPKNLFAKYGQPVRIDQIKLIKPEEVELIKRIGIKNGIKKEYLQPDLLKVPKFSPPSPALSLGNLAPNLPAPVETKKSNGKTKGTANTANTKPANQSLSESRPRPVQDGTGNIYFDPKKERNIRRDQEQDNLKQEAFNNNAASNSNPVAQKMSNFEIRYERPAGVSEDELNSDEKAYYSFFKRSYASYLAKLYATYDKVVVERPGIEKDFSNKHVLLGRIDYDEKGNIILVKILKSSESDDIHYFFEETLKQLNLPNPPKSFIKNKKQFSTYYQIQIN